MNQEKAYYEFSDRRIHIRYWVLGQMLAGAGKAALFVLVLGFGLYALYLMSLLLPAESKQAPPPMPTSMLEQPLEAPRQA